MQLALHLDQLLGLGLGQLEDRDAGPHRDDVGDLFLAEHRALALLAFGPLLFELALAGGELAFGVTQVGGLLEFLGLDRGFLLAPGGLDLFFEIAVDRWSGHRLDPHPRGGFVNQVDRLVRQETVGDVTVGQLGRGFQGVIGDLDLVVLLVALAQAFEDLHGLFRGRLFDPDLLEAALQGRVAFEVLAVLVEGGRADRLDLATGQGRLEDRGRVNGALGGAGTDQIVDLVDEEDDVTPGGDFLHHFLEPFLELAAVLGAGDQCGQVQGVDLLAAQHLRDLALDDAGGQTLDHGGLADPGLTQQDRVVLGAAGKDLHDPLDLGLATDDRIQLAVLGQLGQVAAELVEQLRGLLAGTLALA